VIILQLVSPGGGFRLGRKSLLAALRESLKRMGKEQVDLYQVREP
jgi:aryl-alcohol dehydrogenase-like predicted oxidoreductase